MQVRPRIANALEFCERYGMGEDCRALAERHPRLYDFWEHCERDDWMFKLVDETGSCDSEEFLRVFHGMASERKDKYGEPCGNEPYNSMIENDEGLDESDSRDRKLRITCLYAEKMVKLDAVLDSAARSDLAAREGRNDEVSQDRSKARMRIRKHHAQLLRDLLGNPYDIRQRPV